MSLKEKEEIFMRIDVHKITGIGVLIAINIVLGKLSIGPAFASVNFGFIALVVAGYLYGIKLTMILAVMANLVAFTFMGSGSFSFLFLLPAFLAGGAYGLLKKPTLIRIILVNVFVVVGISFFLNTSLISYVYHLSYRPLLVTRIFKMIASLIVQIIITSILLKNSGIKNLKNKLFLVGKKII